ncbi:hypothetical protein [Xanthomarina gelatinilytica]|uniref:hypothetical protein n=1 Tax=Xanthomarina gelatinilytica TaxID=1137281 RepID=UPI003AA8031C
MYLQPLKIPSGWSVEWNVLTETDPSEETIHEFTGSSLLLLNSSTRLKAIDVSWRSEGDINGAYYLQVICLLPKFNVKTNTIEYDGLWETPELEFTTKNRLELVDKIHELLFTLKPYKDERILIQPGVVDDQNELIRLELQKGLTSDVVNKIIKSNHKKLQDLLLNHEQVLKQTVEELAYSGVSKGIKNKAKQLLKSKRFKA